MEDNNKNITDEGRIVNHNTNCQVFNGPVSGSIFAMPGSHVTQHPQQTVGVDGKTTATSEEPNAEEQGDLVNVPENLPIVIMQAPEKTIKGATNNFVINTLQEAGALCVEPWHYACLMAVCDDHGVLIDRTNVTGFARTMVAWGIEPFTTEDAIRQLANSMGYTLKKLPLRYLSWDNDLIQYKNKCEQLATYFDESMPYRHAKTNR